MEANAGANAPRPESGYEREALTSLMKELGQDMENLKQKVSPFSPQAQPPANLSSTLENRPKAAELQLAAQKLGAEAGGGGQMQDLINAQVQAFKELMQQNKAPDNKSATIRVKPKINWPHLGDDSLSGKDTKKIFHRR